MPNLDVCEVSDHCPEAPIVGAGVSKMEVTANLCATVSLAEEHLQSGHLRGAIEQLLRLESLTSLEEVDGRIAVSAALLLTKSYARLGFFEDAGEWMLTAQRRCKRFDDIENYALLDATHTALLHWSGHEVNAIRTGNAALMRHSRRASDSQRRSLLHTLGCAYLRVGQIVKAEQCVDAIFEHGELSRSNERVEGYLLRGEIKLWSILREDPLFRSQVLVSDALFSEPASRAELLHAASEAYARAAELAGAGSLSHREATAGLAKARLAERSQSADWSVLELHGTWLGQRGLNYERNLTRLHIGVLLLLRRSPLEARQWLVPLADAALNRAGAPLEHDALYFASVACAESGYDRAAWNYMHRYNAGIRDQHLARGTVPPPSLETRSEQAGGRSHSRRRGESERELVDQVVERLRIAPSARFDSRQLAQFAGVSRRTLENVFRRVTGSAPKEFTTRLRLEEFKRQLLGLHNPVHADLERLSRAVGFSSYRVLARCDKRLTSNQKKSADLPF